MSNVHKLPNARIGSDPDPETVALLRDALTRAERGDIQSIALFAIESSDSSTRAHHIQTYNDAQILMAKAQLFIHEMCHDLSANATSFPIEPDAS